MSLRYDLYCILSSGGFPLSNPERATLANRERVALGPYSLIGSSLYLVSSRRQFYSTACPSALSFKVYSVLGDSSPWFSGKTHAWGAGSIPGWGTEIPPCHAVQPKKKSMSASLGKLAEI